MRNLFLILIFLLSSCGYQPLYSNKNSNKSTFKEIEIRGDKIINRSLISSTFIKKNKQNFRYEKIIIESSKKIIETSKNSKGQPESFRMTINLKITVTDNDEIIKEKAFSEAFSYRNLDNKSDLSDMKIMFKII